MPYLGRPSPPNGPGLYRTPAFIMLLAALYLSSRCRRGLRFAPSRRLRWIDCGAIMTVPAGACTSRYSYNSLRARRSGFSHRVGASCPGEQNAHLQHIRRLSARYSALQFR